jgi:hypothetical protein
MTVELWYGSWPEHRSEQEALIELYHFLSIQPEHFVILAHFEAGPTNEIDLVVVKEQGIFIAELKRCNAKLVGQKEGSWKGFPPGEKPFTLYPKHSNPYKQVKVNWARFMNWCEAHRDEISAGVVRAEPVDYRAMRSFAVIAPDLHPDSEIDVGDWPVHVMGLPRFLTLVMMYTAQGVNLTRQELSRLPHLLNLTQWHLTPPTTEPLGPGWQPGSFALLVARGHDLSAPLFNLGALAKETITVGRDADNDLIVASPSVSRHHAEVKKVMGRYVVRDLDSDNGTFVSYSGDPAQERRLAPGAENALKNASLVRFGPASYTLLLNA